MAALEYLWHHSGQTKGHQGEKAVRIERPPYFADIVQDVRYAPAVWHCIVQRYGSSKVITWFQEESEDAAQHAATTELEHLRRQDLAKAGQLPLTLSSDPNQAA